MNQSSRNRIALLLLGGALIVIALYVYKTYSQENKSIETVPLVTQVTTPISNESLALNMRIISPQGVHIFARVANTDSARELGLSYFKSLPDGQGMLFAFPQMGIYPFWMKDMNFPLDIVWIDENLQIIDRVVNVSASSYPETFTSSGPASYAIELPANTADRDGFLVGKKISLQQDKE